MYSKNIAKSTPASMRERWRSRHSISNTHEATKANGMSRFTVDFRMVIGATKAAQPTMSRELKMLDPKTLPTAMSGVDFKADSRLTKNSGMEVPMATIVSPITICDMCMRSAIATAQSVNRSAPHNTRAIPAIIHKMFNHIIFVFTAYLVAKIYDFFHTIMLKPCFLQNTPYNICG